MLAQAALTSLRAQLATINDLAYELGPGSSLAEAAELRRALLQAADTVGAMAGGTVSGTGCSQHPKGPVDPVAPEGWGPCLLCNSNRRRGQRSQPPAPRAPFFS